LGQESFPRLISSVWAVSLPNYEGAPMIWCSAFSPKGNVLETVDSTEIVVAWETKKLLKRKSSG
jgi:hypothetical protein